MHIPPLNGSVPDALDWENCTQPCTTFKLFEPAARPNTTTTFFIRFHIGQNMTWDSGVINITVLDCLKGTANIINVIDKDKIHIKPQYSDQVMWKVNNFICDYEYCCNGMITGVTQDDPDSMDLDTEPFSNYSLVQVNKVLKDIDKIELKFPTAVKRNMTFRVYTQSNLFQKQYSPPITILISSERYSNITYEMWLRERIDGTGDDENTTDAGINVTEEVVLEMAEP